MARSSPTPSARPAQAERRHKSYRASAAATAFLATVSGALTLLPHLARASRILAVGDDAALGSDSAEPDLAAKSDAGLKLKEHDSRASEGPRPRRSLLHKPGSFYQVGADEADSGKMPEGRNLLEKTDRRTTVPEPRDQETQHRPKHKRGAGNKSNRRYEAVFADEGEQRANVLHRVAEVQVAKSPTDTDPASTCGAGEEGACTGGAPGRTSPVLAETSRVLRNEDLQPLFTKVEKRSLKMNLNNQNAHSSSTQGLLLSSMNSVWDSVFGGATKSSPEDIMNDKLFEQMEARLKAQLLKANIKPRDLEEVGVYV
mmetsp:Transcript_16435/g.40650  ORF Transcript_16435/g.40650 Transcript_16435/m.40650 type:complete len:314 (+) Transcript_16435:180-1121(+)